MRDMSLGRIGPLALAAILLLQGVPFALPGVAVVEPAAAYPSPAFGNVGDPQWDNFQVPALCSSAEPTVGVAWHLGDGKSAMYEAIAQQFRIDFVDTPGAPSTATMTDVTSPWLLPHQQLCLSFDPILYTNYDTDRTWAGELTVVGEFTTSRIPAVGLPVAPPPSPVPLPPPVSLPPPVISWGWVENELNEYIDLLPDPLNDTSTDIPYNTGCTVMSYTDDNGATWFPTADACSFPGWDHQSIGSGPWASPVPDRATYPAATYYCSQDGFEQNCWLSYDGGVVFEPVAGNDAINFANTLCRGLHGHIRVSPYDGTMVLPNKNCNNRSSFVYTRDNGVTWGTTYIPFAPSGSGHFDPSAAFGSAGTLYFGQAENDVANPGAFVAVTRDMGLTFLDVGTGNGAPAGTKYFDVSSLVPDVQQVQFAEVIAGDDDRAAFAFLGSPEASDPGVCASDHTWHMYVAFTYDSGKTWKVSKASADPVQRGGIWPNGGGEYCRNMLDFNDIVIDADGRVLIAYTDGCITAGCTAPAGTGDFARQVSLLRQRSGFGLFAEGDREPKPGETGACAPEAPIISITRPGEGDLVRESEPPIFGEVDRHRELGAIDADAGGPYRGPLNAIIEVTGTASCGSGSYDCKWRPIGTAPEWAPGPDGCTIGVDYGVVGPHRLELITTDRNTGGVDRSIALITVDPPGAGPPGPPPAPPSPCPGEVGLMVDDDDDRDHTEDPADASLLSLGANEIKCFGAWFDGVAFEFQVQVNFATNPTRSDSGDPAAPPYQNAQRYWVVFTPDFGPRAGQVEIIETFWNGFDVSACFLVPRAVHDNPAGRIGGQQTITYPLTPASFMCDPNRVPPTATWAGIGANTLRLRFEATEFSRTTVGGALGINQGAIAGGELLEDAYAYAWHLNPGGDWHGTTGTCFPCAGAYETASGAFFSYDSLTGGVIGFTSIWDDDFSPECEGHATIKFTSTTSIGLVSNCAGTVAPTTMSAASAPAMPVPFLPVASAALGLAPLPAPSTPGSGSTMAEGGTGASRGHADESQTGRSTTAHLQPAPCSVPPPTPPPLNPPSAMKEFVRLLPDWGTVYEQYIEVDTTDPDQDDWKGRIGTVGLSPFFSYDNGIHTLRAEWYDEGGTVLHGRDCVAFEVRLIDPNDPFAGGDGAPEPQDRAYDPDSDEEPDFVSDRFDNCAGFVNTGQEDTDKDGVGDACDDDMDGDRVGNFRDNCPRLGNPNQRDNDADGQGDACDQDDDNDTVADLGRGGSPLDNCPRVSNPDQDDMDGDGLGDACEGDRDNDGVLDIEDVFPDDPEASADEDLDGRPDVVEAARATGARRDPVDIASPADPAQIGPAGVGFVLAAIVLLVAVGVVASRRT